jgi:hypothetical protein
MNNKNIKLAAKPLFKDLVKTFDMRLNILNKTKKYNYLFAAERDIIDSVVRTVWAKDVSSLLYYDRKDLKNLNNGTSGVYLIYNKHGALLYIGKSSNIKTRISTHFTNYGNVKILAYLLPDIIVPVVEIYLISHLIPRDNNETKNLYDLNQ